MENPIKMDDFGVPLYLETPKWNIFHQDPTAGSVEATTLESWLWQMRSLNFGGFGHLSRFLNLTHLKR